MNAAQLKTCEADAEDAMRLAEETRVKLEGEWEKQRVALIAERDAQKKLTERSANELATCNDERTRLAVEHNEIHGSAGPTGIASPAGSPPTGPATIPASPHPAHAEGDDDDPYK